MWLLEPYEPCFTPHVTINLLGMSLPEADWVPQPLLGTPTCSFGVLVEPGNEAAPSSGSADVELHVPKP